MSDNQIVVKVNKCTLVLYENELMGALVAKPELFQKAIKRGKSLLRAQDVERQKNMLDRWAVFEALRGNPKYLNSEVIHAIETVSTKELREGVIEYILQKQRGNV